MNNFFMRTLVPWLLRLHDNCSCGQLRNFVNSNQIRFSPLAVDNKELLHIAKGMALLSKNVHARYEVLGVPTFVIPQRKKFVCGLNDHQRLCRLQ